jgi:ribosomal protein S19
MKIKHISNSILRLLKKGDLDNNKPITIFTRESIILPQFENQLVNIYNGSKFTLIRITSKMIGFKFGDFVLPKLMTGSIHSDIIKNKQTNKKLMNKEKKK